MIKHKTFQTTHLLNVLGTLGLNKLEELRAQAERYIVENLQAGKVVSITETRDLYASSVTIWYQSQER
jgi:hypothetical protein